MRISFFFKLNYTEEHFIIVKWLFDVLCDLATLLACGPHSEQMYIHINGVVLHVTQVILTANHQTSKTTNVAEVSHLTKEAHC
jgi:hypothetical protein